MENSKSADHGFGEYKKSNLMRDMTHACQLTLVLFAVAIVLSYTTIAFAAQVTLAWDANTEADLAGYHVYSKTGSPPTTASYDDRIILCNPGADPPCDAVLSTPGSPQHNISNVSDSETTFFAVTAYDTSGNESGLSNVVSYSAINEVPDPPVAYLPVDGDTDLPLAPGLQTETFFDPDGNGHALTQWQISEASDFSSLVLDVTSASHLTSLTVPDSVLEGLTTYYWRVRFYDDGGGESGWSNAYSFETEASSDDINPLNSVPDDQEADGTADVDNNGIFDVDQMASDPTFKSIYSSSKGVHIAVKGITNVVSIESIKFIDPTTISDTINMPAEMPFGLISMKLRTINPGDTAEVVVYFSEVLPSGAKWYKYDSINGWQDYSAHAAFNADGTSVVLEMEDGGYGDSDGVANGIIVDPGAVAGALASATETETSVTSADSGGGSAGGCFIATAAFGSYAESHVKLLRDFRDQYLLTNAPGRCFVKSYYKHRPLVADYIREHGWLRPIVRLLLTPLAWTSYFLLKTSLGAKVLAGLLPLCLMLICIRYRRRSQPV